MKERDAASPGDRRRLAMGLSLAAAALMVFGKVFAFLMTGSAAIFADAAESFVHAFATGGAAFALRYAEQPRDADHPYGHGKIVYMSAGFEGALILIAGVGALGMGIRGFWRAVPLEALSWGVAIIGGLAALNLALGLFLVTVGRRQASIVLQANGRHVLADVWTGAGAVVGVSLTWLTGNPLFDPAAGIVVGAVIFVGAYGLLRDAYRGLMDRADPEVTEALVSTLDAVVAAGRIRAYHALRHRRINDKTYVEVHLLLPGVLSLDVAHRLATEVEERLQVAASCAGTACITTHLEPADADLHRHDGDGAEHHG